MSDAKNSRGRGERQPSFWNLPYYSKEAPEEADAPDPAGFPITEITSSQWLLGLAARKAGGTASAHLLKRF